MRRSSRLTGARPEYAAGLDAAGRGGDWEEAVTYSDYEDGRLDDLLADDSDDSDDSADGSDDGSGSDDDEGEGSAGAGGGSESGSTGARRGGGGGNGGTCGGASSSKGASPAASSAPAAAKGGKAKGKGRKKRGVAAWGAAKAKEFQELRCGSAGRGSMYDSHIGITCHFCRQKKLCGEPGCPRCSRRSARAACIGKTECARCHGPTGRFCRACLQLRYGQTMEAAQAAMAAGAWLCPHCYEEEHPKDGWMCNSSICMKRRGFKPTGIAIYDAQARGHKSVAHWLQALLKKRGLAALRADDEGGEEAEESGEGGKGAKRSAAAAAAEGAAGGEQQQEGEEGGRGRRRRMTSDRAIAAAAGAGGGGGGDDARPEADQDGGRRRTRSGAAPAPAKRARAA